MTNTLLEQIKRSLTLLEVEFMIIPDRNIIRLLGDNYGLIQIALDNESFKIFKIIEKSEIDKTILDNLDCINFDLDKGKYYFFDNELWFEITVINDSSLTLSKINDSIATFCDAPNALKAL